MGGSEFDSHPVHVDVGLGIILLESDSVREVCHEDPTWSGCMDGDLCSTSA